MPKPGRSSGRWEEKRPRLARQHVLAIRVLFVFLRPLLPGRVVPRAPVQLALACPPASVGGAAGDRPLPSRAQDGGRMRRGLEGFPIRERTTTMASQALGNEVRLAV